MLWPDETDSFTPEPNKYNNIWFARDLKLMSYELMTEPVLVVVSESSLDTGSILQPVGVNIANDHFSECRICILLQGGYPLSLVLFIA